MYSGATTMPKTNINSHIRITKLDGIRGILSILVALNHSYLVLAIPAFANVWGQNYFAYFDLQSKIQQLLMILGNGGAAVSMFFILSGFVISLSMQNFQFSLSNYLIFLLKRLVRLYPVYLFIVTMITLTVWSGFNYRLFPDASTWYHWWMNFNLDFPEYLRNAFFVHINLGGVTWTLRVILLATPILPFLYFLSKKLNWAWSLLFSLLLVYASFSWLNFPNFRDFRYLYMFFLGLVLPQFKTIFTNLKPVIFYLISPLLLYFFFVIRYQTDEYVGGVFETVASFIFLGIILYQPRVRIFDFLDNKFFVYLGKISYSLYLVHFSVLYALARIIFQFFPFLPFGSHYLFIHTFLFLVSLGISIPVSHWLNKYIEIPPVTFFNKFLYQKT